MPRILYTVLDWGLGHATRSIPLIRRLSARGAEVVLAGEGPSLELLRQNFPDLPAESLQGIQIHYPDNDRMAAAMWRQRTSIRAAIAREHQAVQEIITRIRPDAIVSDHRYGAWSDRIPSIFIAHQLWIKSPALPSLSEPLLFRFHLRYLRHFTSIWVPDTDESPGLSGVLGHHPLLKKRLPLRYIGPLSQLADVESEPQGRHFDLLGICSGPEPARTHMEELLRHQFLSDGRSALLIRGLPSASGSIVRTNVTEVPHLGGSAIRFFMEKAKIVIARSGYSTLMDLCALKKTAIVIPTPGQTEQEYLAGIHQDRGWLIAGKAHHFSLAEAERSLINCHPPEIAVNSPAIAAVDELLAALRSDKLKKCNFEPPVGSR